MSLSGKGLPEKKMFPSPTARDGRLRANSARTGAGQGKGSVNRYVQCRFCGFTVDMAATDHSGGTQDGNGGYGPVTKTAGDAVTNIKKDLYTDGTESVSPGTGESTISKGKGCPLCGSKNYL